MTQPFQPPLLLRNPHLQSIVASSKLRMWRQGFRQDPLPATAAGCLLDCGAGVRLQGLHNYSNPRTSSAGRGLVVLLHGWEGCSDSNYLRSLAHHLQSIGFDTFRLNFRDHGDTHQLNEGLFHSCRLDEVVGAIKDIANRFDARPIHLVGFSLGGNFALRVALRAPAENLSLGRVVSISPVIVPAHTLERLEQGPSIYRRYFIARWRRSLLRKQVEFPHTYDFSEWLKLRTLTEMTRYLVEGYAFFPNLENYLEAYSVGGDRLSELTVPASIFTAVDDPIIPVEDTRALRGSPSLQIHELPRGGHCGFLLDYRLRSWVDQNVPWLLAAR